MSKHYPLLRCFSTSAANKTHVPLCFQDYTITMYLNQYWRDERLEFSQDENESLTLTGDFAERIWVPDTFLANDKSSFLHDVTEKNKMVRLYGNGSLVYGMRWEVLSVVSRKEVNKLLEFNVLSATQSHFRRLWTIQSTDAAILLSWILKRSSIVVCLVGFFCCCCCFGGWLLLLSVLLFFLDLSEWKKKQFVLKNWVLSSIPTLFGLTNYLERPERWND